MSPSTLTVAAFAFIFPAGGSPEVTHGPFVGHVTKETVSIWARGSEPGEFVLRVAPSGSGDWVETTTQVFDYSTLSGLVDVGADEAITFSLNQDQNFDGSSTGVSSKGSAVSWSVVSAPTSIVLATVIQMRIRTQSAFSLKLCWLLRR